MRHLIAVTAAVVLLPTMASATTYACRPGPGQTNGSVTVVTVTDAGVAIRAGALAYVDNTPSKALPDVSYFARMTATGPTWGARFTGTGHEMYRYTLHLATGELYYRAENSNKIAGRCFPLSDT